MIPTHVSVFYLISVYAVRLQPQYKKQHLRRFAGRLWQKTCREVICCYVSHHPTVLSPLSRLRCDNQKLVYFLVNSSHLYVLSCKFISRITLLSILISYVTLFHLLLPCSNFGGWDQPLLPNACDTSDNIYNKV